MPDKVITPLQRLDINYLTDEQYEELVLHDEVDPNAIYITPSAISYGELTYKPSINDVVLVGNKTLLELGIDLDAKQDVLTSANAGEGITIEVDSEGQVIISSTGAGAIEVIKQNGVPLPVVDKTVNIMATVVNVIDYTIEG